MLGLLPVLLLHASSGQEGGWEKVWHSLKEAPREASVPRAELRPGHPLWIGTKLLFRMKAPPGTRKVFLAGSFNGWAANENGRVADSRFLMKKDEDGLWTALVPVLPGEVRYKFVLEDSSGVQTWTSDPSAMEKDSDGNSIFSQPRVAPKSPGPVLACVLPPRLVKSEIAVSPSRVWTPPGGSLRIAAVLSRGPMPGGVLRLRLLDPFGRELFRTQKPAVKGRSEFTASMPAREGGWLAEAELVEKGSVTARGSEVVTTAASPAFDLRYGFFALYPPPSGDYEARAEALARLHINAVEFYDWFPAHGSYAPTQADYRFEPFGTQISAGDIEAKIRALRDRGILSLAYVAAYAASESVYSKHPYPMTDSRGVLKIFNGAIMPEDQADREGKPKWFWIMDIGEGSPWRSHVLDQFRRALAGPPESLFSFDGFEIDTYGDSPGAVFHSRSGPDSGRPLRDVLQGFVKEARSLVHRIRPHGLVSFNSVNEFAADEMRGAVDFPFLEIWRSHTNALEGLTEIALRRREPGGQRAVLKVYPKDMEQERSAWPPRSLRRVLGAVMTGGGSLMTAGEPDGGTPRALSSLYYPDCLPMAPEAEAILRAYSSHDALLYGVTHGPEVVPFSLESEIPEGYTRAFASPSLRTIAVQLLRAGPEPRWSAEPPPQKPLAGQEFAMDLPGGVGPASVWYASPDFPELARPLSLPFTVKNGRLRTVLPRLLVHGTLILRW